MPRAAAGKSRLLPPDYLLNLDENGAVLKNYENKTYHYPQPDPQPDARRMRELPMVGTAAGGLCSLGAMDE